MTRSTAPANSRRQTSALRRARLAVAGALAILAMSPDARAQVTGQGTNFAVIVGLDYNWSEGNHLHFTISDARRFKEFLHAPAANTVFMTDDESDSGAGSDAAAAKALRATRDNVIQQIRRVASKAKPEDTFWFYFSGHGQFLPETETSFLVPADIKALTAQTGISVRELRTLLADPSVCRARTKILVLDACESGSSRAWHEVDGNGSGGATGSQSRFAPVPGVITFAAARPDRSAWETSDNPVAGGIFTYYLCCGLAGAASASAQHPVVTLDSLEKYVVSNVNGLCERLGHPKQEPVFLAPAAGSVGGSASVPAPDSVVVGHYSADELAELQPDHASQAATLQQRPILQPGVILVVDCANPELQDTAQTALAAALSSHGVPLFSWETSPEFLAALRDPKRTAAGLAQARRLSARLLLRVHVSAVASPAVVAGMMSASVRISTHVTDVYGAMKASPKDVVAGPGVSDNAPSVLLPFQEDQIRAAVEELANDPSLLDALPKKSE